MGGTRNDDWSHLDMSITAAFGKLFSNPAAPSPKATRDDARIAFRLTGDEPFRASAHS
jgi:hypothetical protein